MARADSQTWVDLAVALVLASSVCQWCLVHLLPMLVGGRCSLFTVLTEALITFHI
jgi:hypothetical protein